ncbi:MAG: LexA family transcriptional regulator [Firmicutes bacterium]|nr:LexA family transcriptional regulator [Bacillota bacterium]
MKDFEKEVYMLTIKNAIGGEKLTHFAKRAGVSAGNLSRIRKGQPATPDILRRIADASSAVTYEELMAAAGFAGTGLKDAAPSFRKGVVRIPIVSVLDRPKAQLLEDESLPYAEEYVAFLPDDSEYLYFIANDDAFFPEGSRLLVDVSKKFEPGNIVLFVLDGNTMIRRLTKNGSSYFYYGDDLKKYPMTPVRKSDMEVYGVVVRADIPV